MTFVFWCQIVSAVFAGGLMLSAFIWALWTMHRLGLAGVPDNRLPFRLYAITLAALAFMIWATYSLSV